MSVVVERVGGLDGMRVILRDLYDRLFADPMIGFFFAGRDKALLVERQLQFTAAALGAADVVYEGKPIPEAHAGLPILAGHFDRRHKVLADVLDAHGVDQESREAWLAFDRSFRRAVLKQGTEVRDELRGRK